MENRSVTFGANLDIGQAACQTDDLLDSGMMLKFVRTVPSDLGSQVWRHMLASVQDVSEPAISQAFKRWPIPSDGAQDKGDVDHIYFSLSPLSLCLVLLSRLLSLFFPSPLSSLSLSFASWEHLTTIYKCRLFTDPFYKMTH